MLDDSPYVQQFEVIRAIMLDDSPHVLCMNRALTSPIASSPSKFSAETVGPKRSHALESDASKNWWHAMNAREDATKEMIQPCPIYQHAISLVVPH